MSKKRIGLTKKIRFEVFKRDGFTCQYCGDSAPKVVLNVDHIIPVSAGGDNNMMNLITSCFDCNQGKRDRLISDDSLITKQLSQVKEVSDKREQLLMMLAWRDELIKFTEEQELIVIQKIEELIPGKVITESGKKTVKKWLSKYTAEEIIIAAAPELLEALQGVMKYLVDFYGEDDDFYPEHPLAIAKAAIAKATGTKG